MGGKYSKALLLGSLAALPAGIVLIALSFWPGSGAMQPNGFYLGSDFVNYWMGGRLAVLDRVDVAYDLVAYNAQLREWFSPDIRMMNFSYPPHALLGLALFGALPYFVALILWSVLGAAGFAGVALGRWPRREPALAAAMVLAPVIWVNIVFGQLGLWLAVLFVGALRALPTRPLLAGVLFGVLTIKPQLGLLLPLLLLALGSWRVIAVAAATVLVLAAASAAAFGFEPWRAYISETMPFQWQFIELMNGFYRFQMITPYTALWFLGMPMRVALIGQAAISSVIALTAFLVARSSASWPLKCAVITFGSVLMVPYVLAYDLAVPFAALVWHLLDDRPAEELGRVALVGALWALPFGVAIMAQIHGIPLLPIALLAAYFWLVAQALQWRVARDVQSVLAATPS